MHSIWMIGDIQGCCSSLDELLAHPEIAQEPLARFWFAGDLVNRGSQSLATLRRLMALEDRSVALLGNLLFGGVVGAAVDVYNNTGMKYPENINITDPKCP
jgi:hypothetical protein